MNQLQYAVRWKCLLCGRCKFTRPEPHRCCGGFRKRRIKWQRFLSVNDMALHVPDLDRLATGGCDVAGCKHDKHGEIWFHGRCHITAHLRIGYKTGALNFICEDCFSPITQIAVIGIKEAPVNVCHPQANLYARYRVLSGVVDIFCPDCKRHIQAVKVAQ